MKLNALSNIYMKAQGFKKVPLKTNGKPLPAGKDFVWQRNKTTTGPFYNLIHTIEKVIPWTKTKIKFIELSHFGLNYSSEASYKTVTKNGKKIKSKTKELLY